jgi:hypothetical protein
MWVPPNLAEASDGYAMNRPAFKSSVVKQTFTFGPYTASNVALGGTHSSSWKNEYSVEKNSEQAFSFQISDGSATNLSVLCVNTSMEDGVEVGSWSLTSEYRGLRCQMTGIPTPVSLSLGSGGNTDSVAGAIDIGETRVLLRTNKQLASGRSSFNPTGYIFEEDATPLGCVDITNKGFVYLDRSASAETRLVLAAASVAVILFSGD